MPLTRKHLDRQTCSAPDCDHTAHDGLFLHGACHPQAAIVAEYRDGILIITCATCEKFVTEIAVKEAP